MTFFDGSSFLPKWFDQSRDDVHEAMLTAENVIVRYFDGHEEKLTPLQADEFLGKKYHWLKLGEWTVITEKEIK